MTRNFLGSLLLALQLAAPSIFADECWSVTNIKGYSAFADKDYEFSKDGLRNPMLVCFGTDSGIVTGSDLQFVRFGESTLIGLNANDKGNEVVEVYQIDRKRKKLLYVKSRIGTETVIPIFSDVALSFVGDAARAVK